MGLGCALGVDSGKCLVVGVDSGKCHAVGVDSEKWHAVEWMIWEYVAYCRVYSVSNRLVYLD